MKAFFVMGMVCLSGMPGIRTAAQRLPGSKIPAGDTTTHKSVDTARRKRTDTAVLGTVTVRAQMALVERQLDKTAIHVENSILAAGANVLEMMKKLPGIQVETDGTISLNGKAGATVYLDGRASYLSPEDLALLLRGMSAADIQKIELMPNPSAKYDAAGTGGIINIVRKKNRKEGLNGNVRGSYGKGRANSYAGGFDLTYKNGPVNSYVTTSLFNNQTADRAVYTTDIFNDDGSLRSVQSGNSADLNITKGGTILLGTDLSLPGRTTLSLSGTGGLQSTNIRTQNDVDQSDGALVKAGGLGFRDRNRGRADNFTTALHLRHLLDTSGQELTIDLNYSDYPNTARQQIFSSSYDVNGALVSDSGSRLNQNRLLHIYVAQADYTLPLPGKAKLETGWKSSYVNTRNAAGYYGEDGLQDGPDSAMSNYSQTQENINAAYINVNKMVDRVTLRMGLRVEQSREKGVQYLYGGAAGTGGGAGGGVGGGAGGSGGNGGGGVGAVASGLVDQHSFHLFPAAFAEYRVNGKNAVTVSLSGRVQRPSYRLLNPLRSPLSATSYFQGDPGLKPQVNRYVELGYSWHDELTVNAGYIHYRDFYRTFSFLDNDDSTTIRMPANVKSGYGFYFQATYSKRLLPWWSVNNNMNVYRRWFSGSVRSRAGQVLPVENDPIVILSNYITNSFSINDQLSADCEFRIATRRVTVSTISGSYSNLGLAIRRSLADKRGYLVLSVNNLLRSDDNGVTELSKNYRQYNFTDNYSRVVTLSCTWRLGKGKTARIRGSRGTEEEARRGD